MVEQTYTRTVVEQTYTRTVVEQTYTRTVVEQTYTRTLGHSVSLVQLLLTKYEDYALTLQIKSLSTTEAVATTTVLQHNLIETQYMN